MDEQHFRLRGQLPDPAADADAYFECRGNARSLASVRHAVLRGESFVVLLGAAGTGKTALLDTLLSRPGPVAVVNGRFSGGRLDAGGVLAATARALRAPIAGSGVAELRAGLQAWLAMLTAKDRRALLVVDDAQHLLPAALRELTDLASLRSSRDAPMQVVLAGRPELRLSLQHALRGGSAGPVFLFCDVTPLSAIETRWYVEHRLQRAAGPERAMFTDEAYARIHEASDGVPGAINLLCDRIVALVSQRRIACAGVDVVDQAVRACQAETGGAARLRSGGEASGVGVTAPARDDELRPTSRRATGARLRSRRVVATLSVLAFASLLVWAVREYESMLARQRLSSLATATRSAPADPAVRAAPIASTEGATILRLPDAPPAPPLPRAATCSEVVIALGLCSPEARAAEQR